MPQRECCMLWFYDARFDYGEGGGDVHGFALDKPTRIRDGLVASESSPSNVMADRLPLSTPSRAK
jgi:hypothetical protein